MFDELNRLFAAAYENSPASVTLVLLGACGTMATAVVAMFKILINALMVVIKANTAAFLEFASTYTKHSEKMDRLTAALEENNRLQRGRSNPD